MDNDELGLFRAIMARPADDLPRLVYADWLEEHGDTVRVARAEFIRVQCRSARMPANDPDRPACVAREQELLREFRRAWDEPVRQRVFECHKFDRFSTDNPHRWWNYHRGMISSLVVDVRDLLTDPNLWTTIGPIEHLHLPFGPPGSEQQCQQLGQNKLVRRLKVLSVGGPSGCMDDYLTRYDLGGLAGVPLLIHTHDVLDIVHLATLVAPRSAVGDLSPVVALLPHTRTDYKVIDPLRLWSHVGDWSGMFMPGADFSWPLAWSSYRDEPWVHTRRMKQLAHVIELNGLPPNTVGELPPPPPPPQHGLGERVRRWFRRRRR